MAQPVQKTAAMNRALMLAALLLAGCDDLPPGEDLPDAAADDDEPTDDGNEDGDVSYSDGGSEDPGDAGQTVIPSKIRYVLLLVKENHTFDNYFTGFPGAAGTTTAKLSTGAIITRPAAPAGPLPKDICHCNGCGQTAYHSGTMSGFDLIGAGQLPFVHYSEAQIPNYWKYARNFVLADHLFSETLGPSTPGHLVFWTAQSLVLDNAKCKTGGLCAGFGCAAGKDVTITAANPDTCATSAHAPCFDVPVLVDHLPKGFTWSNYGGRLPMMTKSVVAQPGYPAHFHKQDDFVKDLAAGKLTNLMVGHLWSGDVSEHPAANPCSGENYSVDIINAAMQLPQWNEMAIILTWDDWGGFYDHLAPPVKKCANGQIFGNGFRLPAIIISPYSKKGFVLTTPAEQASVTRLIEDLWGMSYMSARDAHARDAKAGSLMSAFDFAQAPRAPMVLPKRTCP